MNIPYKMVAESNNISRYRALLETRRNYAAEVLQTRLKCQHMRSAPLSLRPSKRREGQSRVQGPDVKFIKSKVLRMMGRLYWELSDQTKLIPPWIQLEVRPVTARRAILIKTLLRERGQRKGK